MGILFRLVVACVAVTALLTVHSHADIKELSENVEQILGKSRPVPPVRVFEYYLSVRRD